MPPSLGLRPPGSSSPPNTTIAPSATLRPPAQNKLDDMITLRPQYELRNDLAIEKSEDGSIKITPVKSALAEAQAADTLDGMPAQSDNAESSWARGLAARLEAQLDEGFGTDTPVRGPTRAELQALLDSPPDVTKQQSLDELERLHQETRDRPSEQDLDFTRRAHYPTREIEDADIEAVIEVAPQARRNVIGVAKKPKE
jgi:hypothetical protein